MLESFDLAKGEKVATEEGEQIKCKGQQGIDVY